MKAFFIGLLVILIAVGLPFVFLLTAKAKQEKVAKAAMEEIFIRCPDDVAEFARAEYSGDGGLHQWAFPLVMEIVKDRGGKSVDVDIYKRFVLSSLAAKAEASGIEKATLALKYAASGKDLSISKKWKDSQEEVLDSIEILFKKPLLKEIDETGKVIEEHEVVAPGTKPKAKAAEPEAPAEKAGEDEPTEEPEPIMIPDNPDRAPAGGNVPSGKLGDGSNLDDKPAGAVLREAGADGEKASIVELLSGDSADSAASTEDKGPEPAEPAEPEMKEEPETQEP